MRPFELYICKYENKTFGNRIIKSRTSSDQKLASCPNRTIFSFNLIDETFTYLSFTAVCSCSHNGFMLGQHQKILLVASLSFLQKERVVFSTHVHYTTFVAYIVYKSNLEPLKFCCLNSLYFLKSSSPPNILVWFGFPFITTICLIEIQSYRECTIPCTLNNLKGLWSTLSFLNKYFPTISPVFRIYHFLQFVYTSVQYT